MKKELTLIAAAATVLMSSAALAGIGVTQSGSVDSAEWIPGSNLLKVGDYQGMYAADAQGNPLTEPVYSFFSYSSGCITVKSLSDDVNNYGALDLAGKEILPCEYGDVKIMNEHWIIGFKLVEAGADDYDYQSLSRENPYYLIDTADIYHRSDDGVSLAASLGRDHFQDAYAEGDYIKIMDRETGKVALYDGNFEVAAEDIGSVFSEVDTGDEEYTTYYEDGKQGIMGPDGNVAVKAAYDYVEEIMEDGYARVSNGDLRGMVDMTGKEVVPLAYDSIMTNYYDSDDVNSCVAAGYVAVSRDGLLSFCDLEGNETMSTAIPADEAEICGASAVYTDEAGTMHILAADGTDTAVPEDHLDVRALYYSNGLLYIFNDENYNCGLMDWHGNEILPAQFKDLSLSGDGKLLLANVDYESCSVYEVDYEM